MLWTICIWIVTFLEKLAYLVKKEKCQTAPWQPLISLWIQLDSTKITLPLSQPQVINNLERDGSIYTYWTDELCLLDGYHACHTSLQRSPTRTPASSVEIWLRKETSTLSNLSGLRRPVMVGLREQSHFEWWSRHRIPTNREHNRVDLGKENISSHLSDVVKTSSRSVCILPKLLNTQIIMLRVPRIQEL